MVLIRHRYDSETVVKFIGDPNAGILILSREIFNFPYVYFLMHEWLIENGYATRADWEFGERFFMQRDTQGGSELRVRWRCTKPSRDKMFHFKMDVNWWALGVKETEVVVKGKKLKMNTGELEIKLFPRMVINPEFVKKEGWQTQFLKKFFLKRVIKDKVERLRKELFDDSYRLQEALKTYLKIETYLEEPELKRFFRLRTGE